MLNFHRFDDAVTVAQQAAQLDSNNKEVNMVVRRTRATAGARSKGNELFRLQRYSEACIAYGEGLDHDPYNSVLLCNRATCRSKLGQFEKAIDDCTAALNVRPSYRKARLRRAECNAKLEKWEACLQDYEVMIKETPEDNEVECTLKDAKVQLEKQRSQVMSDTKVAPSEAFLALSPLLQAPPPSSSKSPLLPSIAPQFAPSRSSTVEAFLATPQKIDFVVVVSLSSLFS
ncbi:hypothetical protein TEA_007025 [Camellia sinensis var. sinensis]|uniref:Uncharacterized protein n=1 Tax=Camellia sinensis var. sinensis TaxID=542762 RepID=A0A4S4D9A1_CAMSN|nr:hypothetical protein TEA_007025 [Camellia sinensis var. sinensis]